MSKKQAEEADHDRQRRHADRGVLFVAAMAVDHLTRLEATVTAQLPPGARVVFLASPNQRDVIEYLSSRGSEVSVSPVGKLAMARRIAALRRSRPELTILPLTGERGYRTLKLAGALVGLPRLLILNENGDFFMANVRDVWRHARWRAREFVARQRHLASSGWRLGRQSGLRVVARRSWERAGWRWRGLSLPQALAAWWQRREAVRLPLLNEPRVSIVIPARDLWPVTLRCLRSIQRQTQNIPYEVILVDDASRDATRAAEKKISGLRVVRLAESEGFLGACHRGANEARGEFLLFLHNDVVVMSGWLEALLAVFRDRPDCGAAGSKLIVPGGRLQEAGGIVWSDGSGWSVGRNEDPEAPAYNYLREVDYCSSAALIVRRESWQRIGGFDRRYAPGDYEDMDFCFAVRELGQRVFYQPAAVVRHYEAASAGTDESRGMMKRFQAVNREQFRATWAARLQEQATVDPSHLFRARDRNRNPVILVFDHYVPTADRDAGSLLMDELLRCLTHLGHRVIFWPENLFRLPGYTERQQQRGVEVIYGRTTVARLLQTIGNRVDVAIAHRAKIAAQFFPEVRPFAGALCYIAADLEHVREQRRSAIDGKATARVVALRQREAQIVAQADCVAVHSPVERSLLEHEFGARRVLDLPLPAPRVRPSSPGYSERRNLLFVGSTHPPNGDGVAHFAETALPRVRELLGDVRLWIVGRVCEVIPEIGRLPGVELIGAVEDLDGWLDRARVFVAPLRYGAGIKGKIIAAIGAGLPVVSSTVGAEGIGLVHGESVLIADHADEFARCVATLYSEPVVWQTLRDHGLALAAARYSAESFASSVGAMVDELLDVARSRELVRSCALATAGPRESNATPPA